MVPEFDPLKRRVDASTRVSAAAAGGRSSLDKATKLPQADGGVDLIVYPKCQEFVLVQRAGERRHRLRVRNRPVDEERSKEEAVRRARSKLRRYCTQNGLDHMWTLTYAGTGVFDSEVVRRDVERLLARVTEERGERIPYARVFEWHKRHGLHTHMAVPMFYWHGDLYRLWGKGIVYCSYTGGRRASGYLSKYIGKDFEVAEKGKHRYECAQGFPIERYVFPVENFDEGMHWGATFFPGPVAHAWDSRLDPDWFAPPVFYASFHRPAEGFDWEMALVMHRKLSRGE